MRKANIKTATEIERFLVLLEHVESIFVEKQKAEVDYGDIPDEFKGKVFC